MPRFQRGTARRFDIDIERTRIASGRLHSGPTRDTTHGSLIDDDLGLHPEAFPGLPQSTSTAAPAMSAWEEQQRRQSAARAEQQYPSLAGATRSHAEAVIAADSATLASRQAAPRSQVAGIEVPVGRGAMTIEEARLRQYYPDEFDDDDTSPAVTSQRPLHKAHQTLASRSSVPPPLVRQTVRCPCGRRSSHLVLQKGQQPQPLQCDRTCDMTARRNRLADAFGVADPDNYTSAQDRPKVTYSPALLVAAQDSPNYVADLERHLNVFMLEPAARQYKMPPMPREQRKVAHQLAEAYGLTTVSLGSEPHRYVEVVKVSPSASIPGQLLSAAAKAVPTAQARQMAQDALGYLVILTDVLPGFDVEALLSRWVDSLTIEWPRGSTTCRLFFTSQTAAQEALRHLGGGIRGKFRVDPSSLRHLSANATRSGAESPSPHGTNAHTATSDDLLQPQRRQQQQMPRQQGPMATQRKMAHRTAACNRESWTKVKGDKGITRTAPSDPWEE